MAELLPLVQAKNIRRSMLDYLTTTFALTDAAAAAALAEFLEDPEDGIFRGPYVKTSLPFQAATSSEHVPGWEAEFRPYGHQAEAFKRLSSTREGTPVRPAPTIVTTGTGSGKTEAFLYPIIEHVLRSRREGKEGIKALILYPMNALANDQASRLAELITTKPELQGITGALYTGEGGEDRSAVTEDGLITNRYAIRETVPDILLTNYKMLDQLLLREADQVLWKQSADSLQYLVLDEIHTYDGAQGTDVAMLLRRLGLALRHYGNPELLTESDQERPLGRVTPVGTSATLGADNAADMLEFAETIFGEPFAAESLIGETRQSVTQWATGSGAELEKLGLTPTPITLLNPQKIAQELKGLENPAQITRVIVKQLVTQISGAGLGGGEDGEASEGLPDSLPETLTEPEAQELVLKAHPLVRSVVEATERAVNLADLPGRVLETKETLGSAAKQRDWQQTIGGIINALGHVRAQLGRGSVSTEAHLWLRELTRIDRSASDEVHFYWSDEGTKTARIEGEEGEYTFPSIYCRRCGHSGWAVEMAPGSDSLSLNDANIRRAAFTRDGRVRYLISAPLETDSGKRGTSDLAWLNVRQRTLTTQPPQRDDEDFLDGLVQPVLANIGEDAEKLSVDQTCPACDAPDSIRFMGSAISTMLSVSISTLFGAAELDDKEKHALVFTDSVQDAAHRAGFIKARSHSLSLRSVLADAVTEGEITLEDLPVAALQSAGDDPISRHRLVPPGVTDQPLFANFWKTDGLSPREKTNSRSAVTERMAFDAALEFGLNSRVGRTLELTGTINVEVDAGSDQLLLNAAREAIREAGFTADLTAGDQGTLDEERLLHWVRGTIVRMRTQGGIRHRWLSRYIQEDGNRYFIWGGRDRARGMPAFPSGRPAPSFPRVGGSKVKYEQFDSVSSPRSWYAKWSAHVLRVTAREGAGLATELFKQLAAQDTVHQDRTSSGATVYSFLPERVVLQRSTDGELSDGKITLECDLCRSLTPVSPAVSQMMVGSPCSSLRCGGKLRPKPVTENFYRDMYRNSAMRRVVSREHTGILDDRVRLEYERAFKNPDGSPDAPNVLVATPTLEMGIDIGDLSAVFLSSVPKSTSNYRQRVGRAGRRSGNALALTYGRGRGADLPRVKDPTLLIDGPIRPPATYLSAEELVRRQYVATLADRYARSSNAPHPTRASQALGSVAPGTFLGELIRDGEKGVQAGVFTSTLGSSGPRAEAMLREWTTPESGPSSSPMAKEFAGASAKWNAELEELGHRITTTQNVVTELEEKAASPAATEEDHRLLREGKASLKRMRGRRADLGSEHWISVLEEFGVLPNYTLFDDSVTLGVGLSWRDADTGKYESDSVEVSRSSALALREFAPGSTFYAKGLEIEIDAVDLGADGEAVEQWTLCGQCGFADTEGKTYVSCPRCGDKTIADIGSRLPVVELRRATAEIHRDESLISDNSDERKRTRFDLVESVDFDSTKLRNRWGVPGVIGAALYQEIDVRTLNVGRAGRGTERTIAGQTVTSSLFRLCEGCGKQDRQAGMNMPQEHRPWCKYRKTVEEQVRPVALAHHLRTQGLVLHLPSSIALDASAKASLSAALRAGLQRVLGGDPDHLQIMSVPVPDPGAQNTIDGLLLYDQIPGGTGYLPDWAEPEELHRILSAAHSVVADCNCQLEGNASCHKCLLPYAGAGQVHLTSRASAQVALEELLQIPEGGRPNFSDWDVRAEQIDMQRSSESALEIRFRETMRDRLKNLVTISSSITSDGERWKFGSPGGGGGRRWALDPQVNAGPTRPDFLLTCSDMNVPGVAIYMDGYQFHVAGENLRLEDDAHKRHMLREQGMVVLSVTSADLDDTSGKLPALSPQALAAIQTDPLLEVAPADLQTVAKGPVDWLIDWISDPRPEELEKAGRSVPFTVPVSTLLDAPDSMSLSHLAGLLFDGREPELVAGSGTWQVAYFWQGKVLFLIAPEANKTVDFLVAIDDRESPDPESWRLWLRYSNAVALRDWPTTITTYLQLQEQMDAEEEELEPVGSEFVEVDTGAWPAPWRQAAEDSGKPKEIQLLEQLLEAGGIPVPDIGEELPGGLPGDFTWSDERVAIVFDGLGEEDEAQLESAGWTLVEPEITAVSTALLAAKGK